MNLTEIAQAIEQYKNEGQDMHQVMTLTQSLMDSGKTPLGLNQWKLSDKPRMEEFNEDNRIVDEVLRGKADKVKPALHNLELISNFTDIAGAYYWKTQEGIVTVTFRVGLGGHAIPSGNHILAKLPEGYRPKKLVHSSASSFPVIVPVLVWISENGNLIVRADQPITGSVQNQPSFCGSISYVAADA